MTPTQPPPTGPGQHRRRKQPGTPGPRLREIDKPLLESFGPKRHANRDFVTARVARNRKRLRRALFALAVVLVAAGAGAWWNWYTP